MIKNNMVRGCASVLCAIFLAYCSIALAQSAGQAQQKEEPGGKGGTPGKQGGTPGKQGGTPGKKGGTPGARWEGRVERSSKEQSTLTLRKSGSNIEKTCAFDSSTKWVSQYHADKKVNDIDASQVKDGDYVICKGTEEKAGVIHATLISKRLSHSP